MTATEIQAEIDEINKALSYIRKGGQSYSISSGAAGTSHTVTNANYEIFVKHRNDLEAQLKDIAGTSQIRLRAGW